jgi:transcriptional regulator with XRE-family HTH domain
MTGKAKKGRRTAEEDGPHPLDIALGARVRTLRKERAMSQDQLARGIGITFQQVQKYEHGTNRVSYSRLVEISEALDVPLQTLIKGIDRGGSGSSTSLELHTTMGQPYVTELIKAFVKIKSKVQRRNVLKLVQTMIDQDDVK